MSSKARNLSDFISDPAIDSTELGDASVTTAKLSDQAVTPAKLHNTLDLSSKTVTLATDGISGNSVHGGVISDFASTGIDDNASATALTIDSSGNVGIGTDSPLTDTDSKTLEISDESTARVLVDTTTGSGRRWGMYTTSEDGRLGFYDYDAADNRLVINSSGNVGIGTNSPNHLLHIKGSTLTNAVLAVESSSWEIGATGELRLAYVDGHQRSIKGHYDNGLEFYTNQSSPAMTISASGNKLTVPAFTEVNQLYSFSGTIVFDTIQNNGWYQPINYNAAIKRYANIGPGSVYGPSGSAAVFHNQNSASANSAIWCSDKNLFNVIAGCQYWRVPVTGTYTLTARGAGDPRFGSGYGRDITCDFMLYAGEWLRIVCGARGESIASNHCGGCGGTAISVFRQGMHLPVLIAGGGAGITPNSPSSTNTNRNATPPMADNGDDTTFTASSGFYAARDGMGGMGSTYSFNYDTYIQHWGGGGGGGWGSPGGNGGIGKNMIEATSGGRALSDHCPHGGYYEGGIAAHGGFGGGGASGQNSGAAGGGGGWYGGNATFVTSGATSDDTTFLGGGSYCAANTFIDNGTHDTYGQVVISL